MKHINGQGSISYEKDRNAYRAAVMDPDGKRLRKRFATQQEAEEWLTVTRASFFTKTYIPKSDYTLGEWILEYLNAYAKGNLEETTLSTYKGLLLHTDSIADIKLCDLTPLLLQKFFNNEFQDIPASGRHCYVVMTTLLRKAVKLGLIAKNPLDDVEVKEPDVEEVTIFTTEEINKILDFCKNSTRYKRYYPLILLATVTGMRLGEVLGLKWQHVHETYVHVETTVKVVDYKIIEGKPKTKKSKRDITIPAYVSEVLQALPHDCEYVFHTRYGGPLNAKNFTYPKWAKILEHSGVEYKKFHTLRHTHCSILLASGISIAEASKRLGHSSVLVTLRTYAHFIPNEDDKIANKIADIYSLAPTLPPS